MKNYQDHTMNFQALKRGLEQNHLFGYDHHRSDNEIDLHSRIESAFQEVSAYKCYLQNERRKIRYQRLAQKLGEYESRVKNYIHKVFK